MISGILFTALIKSETGLSLRMREMTNAKELKRLTMEEEAELLQRAANGDKEAGERIRIQYWPLVLRASHQLHLETLREEAESVAALSLVEAMNSYDAGTGVPFAAYAKTKVFGDVRSFFRRERIRWNREIVPFDTEEGDSFWDRFEDPGRELEGLELKSVLEEELSKLTPRDREMVEECLIYGRKTQAELAIQYGVSFQNSTKRRKRAVRKLEGLRRILMGQ